MKLTTLLATIIIAFSTLNVSNVSAQTQAEIKAMQEGSSDTKETSKQQIKEDKQAKKAAEKAKKELRKANAKAMKDAQKANDEAAKAEKAIANGKTPKVVKEKKAKKSSVSKKQSAVGSKNSKVKNQKQKAKSQKPEAKSQQQAARSQKPAASSQQPKTKKSSNSMNKPLKTWSVDIGLNTTNPQTDIRYHDFFGTLEPKNEFKYGGQLRVTKMFDNALGAQFQFAYNRIQGVYDTLVPYGEDRKFMQDAGITEGIYFKNNVVQASVNLYWNISNTIFNVNRYFRSASSGKPMKKRWFSLYAYSGIGFSFFDAHVMRVSDNMPVSSSLVLPGVQFQDTKTTEVVVPLALGAKVKLSPLMDLGIEYGYNFVFSDKLDGFNYDHPGKMKNDAYTHASLVLTVKLGNKKNAKEHIEWTNSLEPFIKEISKIAKIERKLKQLTKDEDEDGVSDYFDKDTETAEGATVGANGIALDSDDDGVIDDNDMEKFTAKGAEVDENGRAIDTDGDGVPDYMDAEDGTSKGTMVNFQGREVAVKTDTKSSNEGKLRNLALPSIFFDTDKANIKREYEDELFQMALTIKRNVGLRFVLEGHCDERGSDEYNIELGNRRAEAVKQYLIDNYKLDPAIFSIVSKGKAEILSPRYNINRRVDVIIAE